MTHIRPATLLDGDAIHGVHRSAFPDGESETIAKLAVDLLYQQASPPIVSLVAEVDAAVVGHVAFSPLTIAGKEHVVGYILAPLAVQPEYQKTGVGSRLVETGLGRLSETGVEIVLVYGDPGYYGRFGFSADAAKNYRPPYRLQYPHGWQAVRLRASRTEESAVEVACVPPLCAPELW